MKTQCSQDFLAKINPGVFSFVNLPYNYKVDYAFF